MKKCKSCMSEIDDKAKKCPKCGTDQRSWFARHPILTVILGLFLLGIIGSALGGDSSTTSTTTTDSKTSETKEVAEQEVAQEPTEVDLATFVGEFDKNQLAAEQKYENALVQLTGYVGNISEDILGKYFVILNPSNDEYYFGTSVQCFFEEASSLTSLENGQRVTLKGTVDTQSMNVLVKNCSVVEE